MPNVGNENGTDGQKDEEGQVNGVGDFLAELTPLLGRCCARVFLCKNVNCFFSVGFG